MSDREDVEKLEKMNEVPEDVLVKHWIVHVTVTKTYDICYYGTEQDAKDYAEEQAEISPDDCVDKNVVMEASEDEYFPEEGT